ncbi:MAG: ABC transporter substrate-binding protein [Candidatus Heimdallarchaeum endolithica]|uniref:ABC transporter substrate-binding protein n=1 Tax=Candidatus Heimdallarchaeum endolithica TaxID=2876572 RepID=A0A9Y1BNZ3_9ARCH|nr:MAG: ABC transporter substrate-binding protein [Candidatus Heimdallarchaeum endolithica]
MNKKAFLGIALIFVVSASMIPASAAEGDIIPAFYINLLSPNTNPARNQWAALMENQLPKIGIGIAFHESTGWGNIMPRTWSYPVGEEGKFDYIPTYEDGGYDILFVGWSWGLDWDPTGLYDTASIVPAGDNMYQYSNPTYDAKLVEYTSELDDTARIAKAKELQAILYDDLPSITLIYPREVFGFAKTLSGIDTLLLGTSAQRPENWRTTESDSTITYALPAELTEYNIFVQESYYDAQWMSCVYYGLFGRSQDEHLMEPVIAKNYSVSENKLTFTVDINPDAYFSNGDPVTAYDVDYTYELHMTPAVASSSYGYLTTFFEDNDSIKALDDDTVQFTLKQPYAFALSLLSYAIINKDLVQAYIEENGYDMGALDQALVTGAGPYMLDVDDYDTTTSTVTLQPNPHWALTDDDLVEKLIFTFISGKDTAIAALADGTVDIVDSQYAPVESDYEGIDANVVVAKTPATQEMAINLKHPIIGTGELTPAGTVDAAKSIRKAISHAVPRETIVTEILQGLGAPGINPMPDASVGFDTSLEPYTYDLELAKSLIEDAGYTLETETAIKSGIPGLVFISFLGVASLVALRRFRK